MGRSHQKTQGLESALHGAKGKTESRAVFLNGQGHGLLNLSPPLSLWTQDSWGQGLAVKASLG